MMNPRIYFFAALLVVALLTSCDPALDQPMPEQPARLGNGLFILNYGLASGEAGSIDFYNTDSNSLRRDIFELRNGIAAGKGLNDIRLWKQYALITAEKSSVVWVINASTAMLAGKYHRLTEPGYLVPIDAEKTYMSSATLKGIHVMQTATLQQMGTIFLPRPASRMEVLADRLFAAPAYSVSSNRIYVIDRISDLVTDSISLPGYPAGLSAGPDGKLWVLCWGNEQAANVLLCISPESLSIEASFPVQPFDRQSAALAFDGNQAVYVLAGRVYRLNLSSGNQVVEELIDDSGRVFTSLKYDRSQGRFYLTGYRNGLSDGYLYIFGQSGMTIDSVRVGIQPVALSFNK
ncbi:MAG: hypothetical protein IPM52_04060 [Bacteroidetes bacterium]|nr:hypothetical protein [Bacteroidota bacterium]